MEFHQEKKPTNLDLFACLFVFSCNVIFLIGMISNGLRQIQCISGNGCVYEEKVVFT